MRHGESRARADGASWVDDQTAARVQCRKRNALATRESQMATIGPMHRLSALGVSDAA